MRLTIKPEVLDILPDKRPSPLSRLSIASSTTDLTGSPSSFEGSCTPISLSPAACILRPLSPAGIAVPAAVLVGTYIGPPDNPEQFCILELTGSGSDGDVVKVVEVKSGCLFALKLIPLITLQHGPDKTKYVKAEIVNHRDLNHPHIIRFHTVFAAQGFLCTVMEHASHGTLLDFLNQSGGLPEATCKLLFNQIALAVEYCHRKGVCNRDLKPENILLTSSYPMPFPTVKICDFGYSKATGQSAPQTSVGTPCYMAPEVITNESGKYDGHAADAFACGIILYCLLYGTHPFTRDCDEELPNEAARALAVVPRIVNMDWHHQSSISLSAEAKDLLDKLLTFSSKRISMSGVLRHPWCTSLQPDLPQVNDHFLSVQASDILNATSPTVKQIENLLQHSSSSSHVPQCLFRPCLVRQGSSYWSSTP